MSVAVVGAGFCGLAACWHLLQRGLRVTVFDAKGIGGGASGVAAGLLYPYPGEQGRRSRSAEEAIAATKRLIAVAEEALGYPVADLSGIERRIPLVATGPDIVALSEQSWLITSGMTVFCAAYLEGLWKACAQSGAQLEQQHIRQLEDLSAFDVVVLAAGAGIRAFPEATYLPLSFIKGQLLVCRGHIERSCIAKGYLAKGEHPDLCYLGSTYERGIIDDCPDLSLAQAELLPRLSQFSIQDLSVLECRAGVRVTPHGHYFPLVKQVTPTCWAMTGMGSRGLLYHAYCAEALIKSLQIPLQLV